jgi:hypothetical protein
MMSGVYFLGEIFLQPTHSDHVYVYMYIYYFYMQNTDLN